MDAANTLTSGEGITLSLEAALALHERSLRHYALHLTRNTDDADDLFQETALRALRFWHMFDGANAGAWLARVMLRLRLNAVRRRGCEEGWYRQLEWQACSAQSMVSAYGPGERLWLRERAAAAMGAMPAALRATLELSDVEGYAYKEIASMLGTPVGTVMSRLHRARQLMQRVLGE